MTAFSEALERIPSLIGRLESLSSAWDPAGGCYREPSPAGSLPAEKIQQGLRGAHEQAFAAGLGLSLREQVADLDTYLSGTGWGLHLPLSKHSFRTMIPPFALKPEAHLFFCGLEAILAVLRNQKGDNRRVTDWRVLRLLELAVKHGGIIGLKLKDLSSGFHISREGLGRLFKQHAGMTFHHYMLCLRMLRASELLRGPAMPVKDIAASLGYADSSNFVREFRDTLGTTPAEFRERSVLVRGAAASR